MGIRSVAVGICLPLGDNVHSCNRFELSITGIRSKGVVLTRFAGESNPSKLCHHVILCAGKERPPGHSWRRGSSTAKYQMSATTIRRKIVNGVRCSSRGSWTFGAGSAAAVRGRTGLFGAGQGRSRLFVNTDGKTGPAFFLMIGRVELEVTVVPTYLPVVQFVRAQSRKISGGEEIWPPYA